MPSGFCDFNEPVLLPVEDDFADLLFSEDEYEDEEDTIKSTYPHLLEPLNLGIQPSIDWNGWYPQDHYLKQVRFECQQVCFPFERLFECLQTLSNQKGMLVAKFSGIKYYEQPIVERIISKAFGLDLYFEPEENATCIFE